MSARRLLMVAVVLGVGSFTLGATALAQEEDILGRSERLGHSERLGRSEHGNCYAVVGQARDTWPGSGSVSTGVITGLLNGATQYVYDTDGFPTPDPNVVTFGAKLTFTTKRGIVGARVLFLFDVVTGTWTSIAKVDPRSSTGRFAGATGTLWFPSGTTINLAGGAQAYPSHVTGYLCLAR